MLFVLKIKFASVYYIIIASSLIGLTYNFVNPHGIPLIKKERVLEWSNDSTNIIAPEQNTGEIDENKSVITMDEARAITLNQAYELYNKNALFIDARDFVEFEIGRIKNAISLPYVEFEQYKSVLENVSKDKPIVTYCDGKDCDLSILLGDKLYEMGYKEVYIFFGGWIDWQMANYPQEADE
jgi:rhodanese-related sulfurtransferase